MTRSTFDQPAPPPPRRIEEIRNGEVGQRVAVSGQAPRQTMTPPTKRPVGNSHIISRQA
jgi:hypothetical protein